MACPRMRTSTDAGCAAVISEHARLRVRVDDVVDAWVITFPTKRYYVDETLPNSA